MNININDDVRSFLRENNYPSQYNDGLCAYLRDLLQVNNRSLNDLLNLYKDTFGEELDTFFSPINLFSTNETGAWWDVQDLNTLFSDTAMTTLATVDGLVAAHADKSGNNNHRIQATSGNRPTLRQHVDGRYYLDYSGNKTLSVPTSTSLFKYLHDGTGGSLCAFIMWPQGTTASSYIQTSTSTAGVGIQISKSTSTQSVTHQINRGASGVTAGSVNLTRFALSSANHMLTVMYKNNSAVDDFTSYIDSPTTKFQAVTTNTPSTNDASLSFANSSTFNGREYEVIVINRVLSQNELFNLYFYMRTRNDVKVSLVDYILLLGGQSNMSGRGTVVGVLPEESIEGVYSYTKAEEIRLAQIPEHSLHNRPIATTPDEATSTSPQHGFSLRTAKSLFTNSSKTSLLVPCAIGSTTIADWNTPLTANDRTTLFGALVYRYNKASSKGTGTITIWYGHEGSSNLPIPDYVNGGVGNDYQNAFISLISNVRAYTTHSPLIMIQLSSDDDAGPANTLAATGEAQRQLEQIISNCYMVVAHDVERNPSTDDLHVSRNGMDTIADRVSLAIREHIFGESVNGTGPRFQSLSFIGNTVTVTFDKEINTSVGNYGDLFRVYSGGVEVAVTSANRGIDTSTIVLTCASFLTSPLCMSYGYKPGIPSAPRTDFVKDSDGLPAPVMGPILDPVLLGSELDIGQSATTNNSSGGATISLDGPGREVTVTVVGSNNSYPRLQLNLGMTPGKIYRIYGVLSGNISNLTSPRVRLNTSGTANNVPYDISTGIFSGDVLAGSNTLEILFNGTNLGSIKIASLTCREVL